jgi:hypothetical protein
MMMMMMMSKGGERRANFERMMAHLRTLERSEILRSQWAPGWHGT